MKVYNVGILGFGFIGKVHAYGYLNLPLFYDPVPLRARITHVVTSRPETAEKARQTIGADVAATDYRAVTENPADRHRPHLHAQPPAQGGPALGHAAPEAHLLRQAAGGHAWPRPRRSGRPWPATAARRR